jgi:serine/threonine-protein kinase
MSDRLSRRRYLAGTGAALTIGTLAGCSGGGDGGDGSDGSDGSDGGSGSTIEDVPSAVDDYLSGAGLYEGTMVDATGQDEVTIEVGAGDIGYAFSPPAVRIDSSTTVVWEWTGQGGAHNVASVEGSESDFDNGETVAEEGYTFEQSFDNTGIQLYECTPHSANGMLGAIEVVEA